MDNIKQVPLGLCGLGTVGSALVNLLQENKALLTSRLGVTPVLLQIGARRPSPLCNINGIEREKNIFLVADDSRSKIFIELIGGTDVAFELTMRAFAAKKDVITANKALIAEKGALLLKEARKQGVRYFYEASVAGGIPIIKVLQEALVANRINRISGIINGTANYILSAMSQGGKEFSSSLKEARELGYAEADPTFDINGTDSAHKITILSSLAFGIPFAYHKVYKEGIADIMIDEIYHAKELGFVIKHLAIAESLSSDDRIKKISLRVHPALVRKEQEIAAVNGVTNGIMVDSYPLGRSFYGGVGAGGAATASAVVSDISDCIRYAGSDNVILLASDNTNNKDILLVDIEETSSEFYLRINVNDEAGVLANITEILSSLGISIEGIHQKESSQSGSVPVIIITHKTLEKTINIAIKKIEAMNAVVNETIKLRILAE